jgi:hypothetical protein
LDSETIMDQTLSQRIARQDDRSGHATPVGSIVAYIPGYYSDANNGGFFLVGPGANNVTAINAYLPDNWRVCDGAAFNDAESPIWNGPGRYLPNLDDNRFLRGTSSTGSIGGSDTKILNTPQLPSHNHTVTVADDTAPHGHTGQADAANAPHNHTASTGLSAAPHSHPAGTSTAAAGHTHPSGSVPESNAPHAHVIKRTDGLVGNDGLSDQYKTGTTVGADGITEDAVAPHTHGPSPVALNNAPHIHPVTVNSANAPHTHPVTVDLGTAPHNHTVTVFPGGSPHTHPGSIIGNTGSGDAFNIEPRYMNVVYIVRVK